MPESAEEATKAHELEVSMEAAAVLLSLAMRDTEPPVAELCEALSRIGGQLAAWRTRAVAGEPGPAALNGHADAVRAQLESDVAICIQSLQFHDRLIQQLCAVRGLLASVIERSPLDVTGFGAHRWEEMLRTLRERLSEESQQHLFNLLLRTGVVDEQGRQIQQAEGGSIELF
jgi:hypothetical protein